MRGSRVLGAGLFGFGYLLSAGGPASGAPAPPGAAVTISGTLRDDGGLPVPGRDLDVMLLEHRTPDAIEAGADAGAVVLDGTTTDGSGRFAIVLDAADIPAGYVAPDGSVAARVVSPASGSAVFAVADFDLDGDPPDGAVTAAHAASGTAAVEVEATVVPAADGEVTTASPDGYQWCNFTYESYGWEDTGLGARPYTSIGRIYTRANTAMAVGVYNGSQHRNESFYSVGGGWYRGGVTTSADTSVDWSILVARNTNVDVRAEMQYRHHQLFCTNLNTGARRYPNVGEYYPWRPTGGTWLVPMGGEPFACNHRTDHDGQQVITVSRGRTRTTSGSFSIAGLAGRVNLGLSTSDSTSSTTINRLTVYGQIPNIQRYTLCGSDDIPIYATWVREK